ncbi:MAG: hypothetical protein WDN08_13755 [Rhizomicrobium sp.]
MRAMIAIAMSSCCGDRNGSSAESRAVKPVHRDLAEAFERGGR